MFTPDVILNISAALLCTLLSAKITLMRHLMDSGSLLPFRIKSKLFGRSRMVKVLIATFSCGQLSSQNEVEISFKYNSNLLVAVGHVARKIYHHRLNFTLQF